MSGSGAPPRPYGLRTMPITAADWKRLSPLLDAALDLAPARARGLARKRCRPSTPTCASRWPSCWRSARSKPTISSNRLPEFSARARGAHARRRVPSSGPIACCASSGRAARRRSGWPNASTAPSSAAWRSSCRTSGSSTAASSSASRAKREILAGLEHPHIARLYDAGVDERGRPYLALEYVDGVPPDEYCRAERLDLREKLALFLNILRAVAFAHARLIVHRDLKPNNILIAADCDVRLLDFGIARLLQPDTRARAARGQSHDGRRRRAHAGLCRARTVHRPARDRRHRRVFARRDPVRAAHGREPVLAGRPLARRLRTRGAATSSRR